MSYLDRILRSVTPYDASDKVPLREFQRAQFGQNARHADDAFEDWLFRRNPNAEGPTLWISKRDGVVVGQQGILPVRLKVDDAEYRAAWLIDLMVHPDWRLKGIAPALLQTSAASTDIMLGLGVEDEAYKTLNRRGWTEITRMSYFVRPLVPKACGAGLNAPKLLTQLAPEVLFRGSAALAGSVMRIASGAELEPVAAFDERADAIWALASRDYPIVARRDLTWLGWRFDDAPQRGLYSRYYLRRKGAVVGYAVTRLKNWNGYTAANVVDYFAPRESLAPLLALIFRELNRQGAVAVFVDQVHSGTETTLKALGCLRVRASWRFMYDVADRGSARAARLADVASWHVTPADSDYEHIVITAEEEEHGAPA
ncbi:MAG TPA: GNAT family N-acetyltransferase [Burkholderiales bacterium]|nr:GNAT family N-acetyltransferase [Burkholderiales bacterium]